MGKKSVWSEIIDYDGPEDDGPEGDADEGLFQVKSCEDCGKVGGVLLSALTEDQTSVRWLLYRCPNCFEKYRKRVARRKLGSDEWRRELLGRKLDFLRPEDYGR